MCTRSPSAAAEAATSKTRIGLLVAAAGLALAGFAGPVRADPTPLGPTPYLSSSDSPLSGGSFAYFHLENFEDHLLSTPGVSASAGGVTSVVSVVVIALLVQIMPNVIAGSKLLAGWRDRQRHDLLVRYPVAAGRGIFAPPDHAREIAALNGFIESFGPDATFLDFSGERALSDLLQRKPPLRNPDIHLLSHPPLLAEAMRELNANPPRFVVVDGAKPLSEFDGVPNRVRVPELAAWIDARYPNRQQFGRFVIATP